MEKRTATKFSGLTGSSIENRGKGENRGIVGCFLEPQSNSCDELKVSVGGGDLPKKSGKRVREVVALRRKRRTEGSERGGKRPIH